MGELARRTELKVSLAGVDISDDINKYLGSLTYTDNEEDKTDDLQLSIDDREGVWLGSWLNPDVNENVKGMELSAVIVRKNWEVVGKESVLDCGTFQIDSIDVSGPPTVISIKATSIPYTGNLRTQVKSKIWENIRLSKIVRDIAAMNKMDYMFESDFDPLYNSVEQIQQSDIIFLQSLCKNAGISLKITANIIVLFDAQKYEEKDAVGDIKRGDSNISSYSFGTNYHDTAYRACHVSYTNPKTGQTIEYTYTPRINADSAEQILEINEKVNNREEARQLAMKRLRQKNKEEYTASFELSGDTGLVAGITQNVIGYGMFDGKYIIETSTHTVSDGYTTGIKLRRVLDGY